MSIARRGVFLMGLLAAFSLAGCGGEDDVTGTYTGTVLVTQLGVNLSIPTTVTLSQSGTSVSGTFEATLPTGTTSRGNVTGTVTGSAIKLAVTPSAATLVDCPAALDGTVKGDTISGSITLTCPTLPASTGTFTLTRK